MALGGGTFTSTNKILPGAYINVVSAARSAGAVGERGVVAVAYPLSWNEQSAVIEVTAQDFNENCLKIFGYPITNSKMTLFRDLFKHAAKAYIYNLNASGTKATNALYATAKYEGACGNQIRITINETDRVTDGYDVKTYFQSTLVDSQVAVASSGTLTGLVNNDYVTWATTITEPASAVDVTLSTGADGTMATDHSAAITALSRKSFNVMCAYSVDAATITKYIDACKDSRDNSGVNYQVLVYNKDGQNHEGIINLVNSVALATDVPVHGLLMWTAGASASCPLNSSLTNFTYDGELTVNVNYSQTELENAISCGKFIFHEVGNEVRVLDDVNSYTSNTSEKAREIFGFNQTIRIIDQSVNDIAAIFNNKYNGKIPNDNAGRMSLWGDLVAYYTELERVRAIEGFAPKTDLHVSAVAGNRRAVTVDAAITVINTMTQLYMTVLVK